MKPEKLYQGQTKPLAKTVIVINHDQYATAHLSSVADHALCFIVTI